MTRNTRIVVAAMSATLLAASGRAQTAVASATVNDWGHGTTVSASGGVASASSDPEPVVGGALGWELTPRVMLEGSGLWLDRGAATDAFNAALKVRVWMRRTGASPFVEGGFGLYRVNSTTPGTLPDFYRHRVTQAGTPLASVTFTDPVWHVGGGLNVFLSRHIAIQPAVEALFVRGDGSTYSLGVASFRLAYHFESHPVTPSRRTR